jgi:hypothetical protein
MVTISYRVGGFDDKTKPSISHSHLDGIMNYNHILDLLKISYLMAIITLPFIIGSKVTKLANIFVDFWRLVLRRIYYPSPRFSVHKIDFSAYIKCFWSGLETHQHLSPFFRALHIRKGLLTDTTYLNSHLPLAIVFCTDSVSILHPCPFR